jgi:H+-translocating NAD(P) transhydrogenase subunit alpha
MIQSPPFPMSRWLLARRVALLVGLTVGHYYVSLGSLLMGEELSAVPARSMSLQGEAFGVLGGRSQATDGELIGAGDRGNLENRPSDVPNPDHGGAEKDHLASLLAGIAIFTLASFVGMEVINKVPPTLHTPLMSGSNAISGITVVGSIILTGCTDSYFASGLGFFATVLAMINIVGGFVVTDRMLAMFRRGAS